MSEDSENMERRIRELGQKATQLLTFLSFALVAAILLESGPSTLLSSCQRVAVKWSLRFWVVSLFPILLSVLPIKEFREEDETWYRRVRGFKVLLLWIAVTLLIIPGAIALLCAIW